MVAAPVRRSTQCLMYAFVEASMLIQYIKRLAFADLSIAKISDQWKASEEGKASASVLVAILS